MDLDENAAIHEAAHAVAAIRVGLRLNEVTAAIDEWGLQGSTGLSLPTDYSATRYPDLARKQAVVSLAGPIAEMRSRGDLGLAGALGDFDNVIEYVMSSGREAAPDVTECEAEARRIIEEDWPGIVRVADALRASRDGRVEGKIVIDLLSSASER